ncbi:RNA-directed DNA polymerase, partial [Streptomyces sp. IBSBF 2390]|uniref:RNA-directed DNA polymerase n=1 Tax=Streptomyces sp. IBSBF 2390 TaxID=2903533 RepID=UPI002FDC437E
MQTDTPTELPDVSMIVNSERLKWAIESFDPYKTPGPDGIYPALLQKALPKLLPWLLVIYTKALQFGYIPEAWRKVKVIFIPKAGKVSHTVAKDSRPISLSSFLLKCLERLVDTHIRKNLTPERLSEGQHAYLKGKSTETALHEVVSVIEKGLADKEYTLATFLDIEGAFNNVTTEAIRYDMQRLGVDSTIITWTTNMLSNRKVMSTLGGATITKRATRGTPQGGVISPLLWLLVVNTILLDLHDSGVKTVAYADDVVILARGKFPNPLSELTDNALRKLSDWA